MGLENSIFSKSKEGVAVEEGYKEMAKKIVISLKNNSEEIIENLINHKISFV